ncbi:MAG: hypothetical protein Q9212_002491 [Teloschistes hypoglaucus]
MASEPHQIERQRDRIILFGGQGSSSLFADAAIAAAKESCKNSVAAAILVSKCHASFLEELRSLDPHEQKLVGIESSHFINQHDFLSPPLAYHRNGLIQSTTICLYQLLRYLVELEQPALDNGFSSEHILEATGFCSGLISAAVAASAVTSSDVVQFGTEAFRLAFWTACRTVLEGQKQTMVSEEDESWSLVVMGLNKAQVEDRIDQFYGQNQQCSLRVSAISGPKAISLSGRPSEISSFRSFLGSSVATTTLLVNAWYHGGQQMEKVVHKVMQDIDHRNICFPTSKNLRTILRSTLDGSAVYAQDPGLQTLAQWVVRQMLVHPVDWPSVSQGIVSSMREKLLINPKLQFKAISFGPSSDSLFGELADKSLRNNLELINASPFKSSIFNTRSSNPNDIAIVGMGVNYPKGKDQAELWTTLSQGLSAVSDIPQSRFDISQFYGTEKKRKHRSMPTRHGAFLDDIWGFDNTFFNISPREAKSMDPQQRILLSTTQRALEDAGYVGDATPSFQKASMGCYIGLATGDYTDNLRDDIDVFYSPGTLRAFHSGRISYLHKLSGPAVTIDTACSSSAVSIYQACRAIQNGDCTAAIAGGVNAICSPDMYLGLSCGHFLNESGNCKPFDAAADGYCRAEGCGIFVLKRLSDALAENDRIHGVIKGIEVNQSGNSHSITQPHSETQAALFRRVLKKSNVDPATVSVVEAHGTGTQVGDKGEVESLRQVFGSAHSTSNPLIVSSVKGNIGHAEAASGSAGLAKLLLMLRKQQVAVQASFTTLNSHLAGIDGAGIIIPRETQHWKHSPSQPRRALLNNFGAAGSNVALLLEESRYPAPTKAGNDQRSSFVFNLSTKNRQALETSIREHRDFLSTMDGGTTLEDLCYTTSARRHIYSHRVSLTCSSISDLREKLQKVDVSTIKPGKPAKARVFVFSGQGGTHYGMGEELMRTCPLFRKTILKCNDIVHKLGLPNMLDVFRTPGQSAPSLESESMTAVAQCACVSLEYALAKLLIFWNIKPDYAVGHRYVLILKHNSNSKTNRDGSLGEYAALAIAGALSLEDVLYIVASRAKMMTTRCVLNQSGMVACAASSSTAETIFADHEHMSQLSVACKNSLGDCVVAGPLDALAEFSAACGLSGIKTKKLSVPFGFHSQAMDPIIPSLEDLGKSVTWSPPSIPVASNVYGRFFGTHDFQSSYFALHARRPVLFADIIQACQAQGVFDNAMCIELGPQPITLPVLKKSLPENTCAFVSTLQRDRKAWATLSAALNQISLIAEDVNWREVFDGTGGKLTDVPGHPLQPTAFAIPYQETSREVVEQEPTPGPYKETGLRLLPKLLTSQSSDNRAVFETTTSILGPLISGHNVGGICICPASLFHELVLEASQVTLIPEGSRILAVYNMAFSKPLIYEPAQGPRPVHVSVTKVNLASNTGVAEIEVTVKSVDKGSEETLCCSAVASIKTPQELEHRFLKDTAVVRRQSRHLLNSNSLSNTFRTKLLYETIFTRVVAYSADYRTIKSLSVLESDLEAIGSFQLPMGSATDGYIAPPVFTDTLLHAAGFVANLTVPSEEICICSQVESIEMLYDNIDYTDTFTVYCSLVDIIKGTILADAFAINTAGKVVAVIRGMDFKRLRLASFRRMLNDTGPSPKREVENIKERLPSLRLNDFPATPIFSTTGTTTAIGAVTPSHTPDSHLQLTSTFLRILNDVYGSAEGQLDMDQPLEALGIDSMMQIEIVAKLNQVFPGANIDHDLLFECETLQAVEDQFLSLVDPQPRTVPMKTPLKSPGENPFSATAMSAQATLDDAARKLEEHLIPPRFGLLNFTPSRPSMLHISATPQTPLCLIHDGSGQSSMYRQICTPDRSILAFADPDFHSPALQTTSVEQMASRYIASLSPSDTPSLIIGGWSFGGIVAYEIARQLSASGVIRVRGLVLIDSPLPLNHSPLPEKVINHVIASSSASGSAINVNLLREFKHCARLLSEYNPAPLTASRRNGGIKTIMLRSADTFDTESRCGVEYPWLRDQEARRRSIEGWKGLVGADLGVLEIPGNHFEVFDGDKDD